MTNPSSYLGGSGANTGGATTPAPAGQSVLNAQNLVDPTQTGTSGSNTDTTGLGAFQNLLSPPPLNTFVYAPAVRIVISHNEIDYDVSADMVRCNMIRPENSAATFFFTLQNQGLRYTPASGVAPVFSRMDRITVYMKKTSWIQTFSGYLDSVPFKQLYPGTVDFKATCTLKRLMHMWWDPSLPEAASLLNQSATPEVSGDGAGWNDSGMGTVLTNILTLVGGWNPAQIHIQNFPTSFLQFLTTMIAQLQSSDAPTVQTFDQMLGGAGGISAPGAYAGSNPNAGAPGPSAPTGTEGANQTFYVTQIIAACDAKGMGPLVSDNTLAAGLQQAGAVGTAGTNSMQSPGSQDAWQQVTSLGTNLQNANRSSDGAILGVACSLAETQLRNVYSPSVPGSEAFPNDGPGINGSDCGLFNQDPTQGWGTIAQIMNPQQAAGIFFASLQNVSGWRQMDPGQAIMMAQKASAGSAAMFDATISAATSLVQAARTSQASTASTVIPAGSLTLSGTSVGAAASAIGAAAGGLGGAPSMVSNALSAVSTVPSPVSAVSAVNPINTVQPSPNSEGAINFMYTCLGDPYVWGGTGPGAAGYDCCLRPETMVYGPDGAVPIAELKPGDRVFSYKDNDLVISRVKAAWKSLDQETFKVRTRNRAVVGSANHPFLRLTKTPQGLQPQWVRLDQLKRNDLLISLKFLEEKNDNEEATLRWSSSLREWLDSGDFKLSTILGIEPQGIGPTYDIEVENNHNFIADGLVVHNSGLMMMGFKAIGVTVPHNTIAIAQSIPQFPYTAVQRGDMVLPTSGHVVMWLGDGTVLEAQDIGIPVKITPATFYGNPASWYAVCRACPNGGPNPSAPWNPPWTMGPGTPPAALATTAGAVGTGSNGAQEPVAQNLLSFIFNPDAFASQTAGDFTGLKAFIEGQPLIQMVMAICSASLRCWSSGPDGSFMAWYPDYWGIDGKPAVMLLADIELKECDINLSDDPLTTHVYINGDITMTGSISDPTTGWLDTAGVATVEQPWLYTRLLVAAPGDMGVISGQQIMQTYGIRPLQQSYAIAGNTTMEFLLACQVFMEQWAKQYQTTISMTFMPELFPGMRVELPTRNLQVYVNAVSHSCDYEQGFYTQVTISAPSSPQARAMLQSTTGATIVNNPTASQITYSDVNVSPTSPGSGPVTGS